MKPIAFTVICAALLGACGGSSAPQPSADPKVVAAAKQVWDNKCSTCHGPKGTGNGPGAAALKTHPRAFNNSKWQSDTDDARIKQVMVHGGASVGLSPEMAPNPELADKPAVVDELVRIIRGLG